MTIVQVILALLLVGYSVYMILIENQPKVGIGIAVGGAIGWWLGASNFLS